MVNGESWDNQKCFFKCGFVINGEKVRELNEIVTQEEELTALVVRIGIPRPNLVIEEQLPEFEIIEEQNLIRQLVEEHINIADDDEVEEIAIELEDLEQHEVPKVVSIVEAKDMVTQLISFTKMHSLFSEELDLLSLNATLKDLYNSNLKQSKIHQYFQWSNKLRKLQLQESKSFRFWVEG